MQVTLTNSAGWIVNDPKPTQRDAPFMVFPITGKYTSNRDAKLTHQRIFAIFFSFSGRVPAQTTLAPIATGKNRSCITNSRGIMLRPAAIDRGEPASNTNSNPRTGAASGSKKGTGPEGRTC